MFPDARMNEQDRNIIPQPHYTWCGGIKIVIIVTQYSSLNDKIGYHFQTVQVLKVQVQVLRFQARHNVDSNST